MKVTIEELTGKAYSGRPAEIPEMSSPDDLLEAHRQVMDIAHRKAGSAISKPWTEVAAMMAVLHQEWRSRSNSDAPARSREAMRVAASRAFTVLIGLLRQSEQRANGASMKSELAVFEGWLEDLKMQAPARRNGRVQS